MKAARLHELGKPLRIDEIPVPEVRGEEVLIRVAGAGVCHSDVHIRSGELPLPPGFDLPLTLGHENAGCVEAVGPAVRGVEIGEPVAVWGARGCGSCRLCRSGHENTCSMGTWLVGGGYAEFMRVPSERLLVKLQGLDPLEAAPLADAGLTPYRAIKKALPYLYPGAFVALLGVGGLGHLALQIVKALVPWVRVVAVDVREEKLRIASQLGADHVVDGRGDPAAEIAELTGGEGVQAVLDLVGSDSTLRTAAAAAGRGGIIVLVGLGGGSLPYSFLGVRAECTVTCSYWGSYAEFEELLALVRERKIRPTIQKVSLDRVNEILDALQRGEIHGRAVVAF